MARPAISVALLAIFALTAGASNHASLGYSDETTIIGPGPDACAGGTLFATHDGSFETGYAWEGELGVVPPYYGAFGEGYDLGEGIVYCGAYWLTTMPFYPATDPSDCYVWEGGVDTPPGAVLGVVTGVSFSNIPLWPEVGQNDVDLNISVEGEFTIGYWGNWPGMTCGYFCAADLDGTQGHPWTCIGPGIGYPTGWQDPSIVWMPTRSMGCGVYFEQGTPVESATWGSIKGLFR
jgi:hypothetical protein